MKKSKFLLLGSVASLASIPFVAAKCGETKEEKKPEEARQNQTGQKARQRSMKTQTSAKIKSRTKTKTKKTWPDKDPKTDQAKILKKIKAENTENSHDQK
nr:variable surface lipoprotein [Mycoplasmopsis bovis]